MEKTDAILLEDELYDDIEIDQDDDEETEENASRYDDGKEDEGRYDKEFSLSGVYVEDDGSTRVEYKILYEELEPDHKEVESLHVPNDVIEERETPLLDYQNDTLPVMEDIDYPAEIIDDIISINYESPEFINGQKTYQRIVFEADMDGESVYDITTRKLKDAGIETKAEYDGDFDSVIFTSINNKKEGQDDSFNEFYLNGDIGANAVDLEKVKKGDVIEWRYAEETDGSCGGVPDFSQIKSMVQYSTSAKAYADSLGLLLN